MLNNVIKSAREINLRIERESFYSGKAVRCEKKAGKIIASSSIDKNFARRLAGFEAGEVVIKNYREKIDPKTWDFTTLKFEVNLRNLVRKGYAAVEDGNLVLTGSGAEWLKPYCETTCIFTGGKTPGRF